MPESAVEREKLHCTKDIVKVVGRLAHPHEDHLFGLWAQTPSQRGLRRNLHIRELPHQTALACHAENAADGAPHLSGNANPSARQQHLFNGLAVSQCEEQPFTLRIRSGMARAHRQHSVESAADIRKGRHKRRRQPSRAAAGRLLGFSAQRIRPCRTRRTQPSAADAAQMRGLRSERTEVRFKSGQRWVRQRTARRGVGAD